MNQMNQSNTDATYMNNMVVMPNVTSMINNQNCAKDVFNLLNYHNGNIK